MTDTLERREASDEMVQAAIDALAERKLIAVPKDIRIVWRAMNDALSIPAREVGGELEGLAWKWLERSFGSDGGSPVDRAYAADEMVDAFLAGCTHRVAETPSEERAREVLAATFEQAGILPQTIKALRDGGDSLFKDESLTIRAMIRFAAESLATTPAPREKLEADLVEAVETMRSVRIIVEDAPVTVGRSIALEKLDATLNRLSGEG